MPAPITMPASSLRARDDARLRSGAIVGFAAVVITAATERSTLAAVVRRRPSGVATSGIFEMRGVAEDFDGVSAQGQFFLAELFHDDSLER